MLKKVQPHDLATLCEELGTTVENVALRSGLSEAELRGFAKGDIALSAEQRLSVLVALYSAARMHDGFDEIHERLLTANRRCLCGPSPALQAFQVLRGEARREADKVRSTK
jgi:hypothetical protein